MNSNTFNNDPSRHAGTSFAGGSSLNGAAGSFAPRTDEVRQSLRQDSTSDNSSPPGPQGSVGMRSSQAGVDLATRRGPPAGELPSILQTLTATGSLTVSMDTERMTSSTNVHRPLFLKGVAFDNDEPAPWFEVVLPYVATLTFVVEATPDAYHFGHMLNSPHLPQLHKAVTKVELPGFHWFSGVMSNRHHNPFLQMLTPLPGLTELTLTMHTAGITTPCYGERQMIALEAVDPVRAKARKAMPVQDVVAKYDFDTLYSCPSLQVVRIQYFESEMVAHFCEVGNPVDVFRSLQARLTQGFMRMGRTVRVDLARVE